MTSTIDIASNIITLPFCVCTLMSTMLLTGATLLAASLFFVYKLANELPKGIYRNSWRLIGLFILLFISGYLGFYQLKRGSHYDSHDILVPIVFLFGAIFVLLACVLTYRTAKELIRISVLEHEIITDPLLGIFNRRFLDRRLFEEMARAKRHKQDLSVMLLDIDYFKRVNDTWGHHNGDLVLKHTARLLTTSLRQCDLVARYGGEEFVVLLPFTKIDEARQLGERLRQAIEQSSVDIRLEDGSSQRVQITVSIGISTVIDHQMDEADKLLERADKALYKAKQSGRNRVEWC